MPGKHDVLADPLPPYLRKKLDWVLATDRRAAAMRTVEPSLDLLSTLNHRIYDMWRLGIPAHAIAGVLEMPVSTVWSRAYWMMARRYKLGRRPRYHWAPPPDWAARLDAILSRREE